MITDARRSYFDQLRNHYAPGVSIGYRSQIIEDTGMATLEQAKLKYLHKKVLDRYLESPTSDDEETLMLMDFQVTNHRVLYIGLGQAEHPVFVRDRWVSEAAAKITDEGYWSWVGKQITSKASLSFNGNAILELSPDGYDFGVPATPPNTFRDAILAMNPEPSPFMDLPSVTATLTAPAPWPNDFTVETSAQATARVAL